MCTHSQPTRAIPRLLSLKRECNALSPASKLSTDLLFGPLLCYTSQIAADYRGAVHESAGFDWLRVLHVCHHWRNAVLDYAPFWARVVARVDMDEDLLQAILQRSKATPISIVYHLSDLGHPDATFGIIAACARRIRGIKIVQYPPFFPSLDHLFESLSRGSDVLETIEFDADHDDSLYVPDSRKYSDGDIFQETHYGVPCIPGGSPTFFTHTPNLRSVKVSKYELPLRNALFCATLRHLELCSLPEFEDVVGKELLLSFQSMPRLESITLRSALPLNLGHLASPETPMPLPPKLRRLIVDDYAHVIVALLRQVFIPDSVSIHFSIMDSMHNTDYGPLRGALSPLVALSPQTVVCWRDNTRESPYAWRCWWNFTAAPAGMDPSPNTTSEPLLDGVRLSIDLKRAYHLYDVIPEHVETLVACGHDIPHIWHPETAAMSSPREIHIYSASDKHVFPDIFGDGDPGQDPSLPSLRVVRFFDVAWGTRPPAEQHHDSESFATVDCAVIVEGLRRRHECGFAPLDELSIARCGGRLEACQVAPMRELVGRVVCDDTVVSCDHAEPVPVRVCP